MKLWSTNMTITSFLGRSLARLPLPSLGGMRYLVETKRRVKTKIVIIQKSYINGSGRVRLPPEEWLEEKKNWYAEGRLMSRSFYTVHCGLWSLHWRLRGLRVVHWPPSPPRPGWRTPLTASVLVSMCQHSTLFRFPLEGTTIDIHCSFFHCKILTRNFE